MNSFADTTFHAKANTLKTKITKTIVMLCAVLTHGWTAHADVWGIKSRSPNTGPDPSEPPATLFRFSDAGSNFVSVGVVTINGAQIDVDGLAMSVAGGLFAFERTGTGSRLIAIDPTTAQAAPVGTFLPGTRISGAVITRLGQLLVLDAPSSSVFEISLSTGVQVGTRVPLTLSGQPFVLSDICDIARRWDGTFIITSDGAFYGLDISTGALTLLFTDTAVGPDGFRPSHAGIAFSRSAGSLSSLFAYDISAQDDIYVYDTQSVFSRNTLFPHIIASYNSGRGDLASLPPEPSQGTAVPASIYRAVEIVLPTIAGKTYQVQATLSLDNPNWTDFGQPVLGDGTEKSVFDKTRDAVMRFYRVIDVQ